MIKYTDFKLITEDIDSKLNKREYNNILKRIGVTGNTGKFSLSNIDGDRVKIKTSELTPSQTDIFLDKIFAHLIDQEKFVKKAIKGKVKDDDILISSDNHIIDGHHRWASAYILNPDCKMKCTQINLTLEESIPVLNELIKNKVVDQEEKSDTDYKYNIYDLVGLSKDDLLAALSKIIKKEDPEKVSRFLNKVYKKNDSDLHPLNYFVKNIQKLPNPQYHLERADMPQLSGEEIEKIIKD